MQVFSCLALSVPIGVRSDFAPDGSPHFWSLLAPRSWKPPSQSTPFARSVVFWRWCGADYSLPLVSSLIAARFGL